MSNARKPWTKEELDILEKYRHIYEPKDFIKYKKLDRSIASIANKLSKMRREKILIE